MTGVTEESGYLLKPLAEHHPAFKRDKCGLLLLSPVDPLDSLSLSDSELIRIRKVDVCVSVCAHVSVFVCMCIYACMCGLCLAHECVCIHACICMYVCVCQCVCVCVFVCAHVCACVFSCDNLWHKLLWQLSRKKKV